MAAFPSDPRPPAAVLLGTTGGVPVQGPGTRPAEGVIPADDAEPAAWLAGRLLPWGRGSGTRVGAVVPTGFDAYVRVLHPALGRDAGGSLVAPVRWAEVADWSGCALHSQAQWERLVEPPSPPAGAPPWESEPSCGEPDHVSVRALVEVLGAHTATPERMWLCVWEGWGGWEDYAPEAARVHLPGRTYLLMTAPITALVQGIATGPFVGDTGPSLWWPDDRAWCVASEIDFRWTYVAGSSSCAADLLAHPGLESLATHPEHRGDDGSDVINAAP